MKLSLGGNLAHHRDFARLWLGETISSFGAQFSSIAIPALAILPPFNAPPLYVGLLTSLAILPYPLFGLFVGVWVDRFRKRRIMVACNVGRMASLATIPIAAALGRLTLDQLFVVAFVTGVFSVFFDISYQAFLPILIERKDLIEGNQKLQVSASGASVAGPPAAGFVYGLIGGALTCLGDAIGYAMAALALLDIRRVEEKPKAPRRDFFLEMREGLHSVLSNRLLWTIAGSTATSNLGSYMVGTPLYIFVLRALHLSVFDYGIIGGFGALGFVTGAIVAARFTRVFGLGRTLAVSVSVAGLAVLYPFMRFTYPIVFASLIAFIIGTSSPIYNIGQVSLRQAITPNRLQGRMNATMRVIVWGTIPVGSILGGYLGGAIGLVDTMYLGGAVAAAAGLWIALGPVVRLRTQPEPLEEPPGS